MRPEAITVIGPGRSPLTISAGEIWPLPFRGSKYTVCRVKGSNQVVWSRSDQLLPALQCPEDLIDSVRNLRGTTGSFRITSHRAVITKVSVRGGKDWEPRYVGIYEDDLEFEGVENDPRDLKTGMYWTGFPFKNGEAWAVSPYSQSRNHLLWRMKGHTFESTDRYPELLKVCLNIRPRGGRMYITESGHIWMNVPDKQLAPWHRDEFRSMQGTQVDKLLDEKRTVLVRLLVDRLEATGARPVYVGHIGEFDQGVPPWTLYNIDGSPEFGRGHGADDSLGAA